MLIDVNAESFGKEVVQSDKPVIVGFWGPRCAPCLALIPQVEALGQKYGEKIKITKLDTSKNMRFCLNLRVLSLPAYLFYKEGREVDRLTGGDLTIHEIEETLKKIIR